MFKQFALCLGPALLAYLIAMIMMRMEDSSTGLSDVMFGLIMVLIFAGAIIAGVCVARKVNAKSKASDGVKGLLVVLTFLGVGIAYLGIGFAGCWGVAAVGEYLSYP